MDVRVVVVVEGVGGGVSVVKSGGVMCVCAVLLVMSGVGSG